MSGGERHVVERLGRRLGVAISEVEVSGGEAKEVLQKVARPQSSRAAAVRGEEAAGASEVEGESSSSTEAAFAGDSSSSSSGNEPVV